MASDSGVFVVSSVLGKVVAGCVAASSLALVVTAPSRLTASVTDDTGSVAGSVVFKIHQILNIQIQEIIDIILLEQFHTGPDRQEPGNKI